ncbi:GTP-binding protein [Fortiea contorta]|uniref:GTP-binding protein n=1 Tax=Fortiea contorta TaxID=1892405 RepID=UPI00034AA2E0|nr:ATP/GTP-binding protein [Fortiea contorta]
MNTLRIVITGGVGAGKTSFIRTISDIEVVDTDKKATDEIAKIKEKTTVALDFGHLTITPSQSLYLYGTPGQPRFDFMWDILIQKANAYILLVAAHRPEDFHYGSQILEFVSQRVQIPMLIGLTHMDCPGARKAGDIAIALGVQNSVDKSSLIVVNTTKKASVQEALQALIRKITNTSL